MIKRKIGPPDWTLLIPVVVLLILGVILVYDASVVRASSVFGGKYYFLILQVLWALLGLWVMWLVSKLDSKVLLWLSQRVLVISIFFLLLTALPRFLPASVRPWLEIFVPRISNSYRWVYLNRAPLPALPLLGRLGFQPSELSKIGVVLYLAYLLSGKEHPLNFLKFILVIGISGGLTLLQPDFGTALIVTLSGLIVYFVSGASLKSMFFLIGVFFLLASFFILSSSYRKERLFSYLRPSQESELGSRYQINQILIALGSGGFGGLGLGQSRQKYDYIPEVNTDSIFAILGEETGFLGTSLLLVIFLYLLYRTFLVSQKASDRFGSLLAAGVGSYLGLQTLINLGGMTHLLPLTGVPLPLVSYGGSSLLVNLFSLGLVLNVSRLKK